MFLRNSEILISFRIPKARSGNAAFLCVSSYDTFGQEYVEK